MTTPPRDLVGAPGWHWLRMKKGDKLPWKWLPTYELWRHNEQSMTAQAAAARGVTYWAPIEDAPAKSYKPAPLFETLVAAGKMSA